MAERSSGAHVAALSAVEAVCLEIDADPVVAGIVSLRAERPAFAVVTDLVRPAAVRAGSPAGTPRTDILTASGAVNLTGTAIAADAVLAPLVREADTGAVPAV
jgi:hypothetical protein